MAKYVFNETGMCTNPEQLAVYKNGKDTASVCLAQAPDRTWCFGYSADCYNGGSSSAAGFNAYRKKYPTREDALRAALDGLINYADHYSTWPGEEGKRYLKMKQALVAYKASTCRWTLFDFVA